MGRPLSKYSAKATGRTERKVQVTVTDEVWDKFCENVATTGLIYQSAERAGVEYSTTLAHAKKHKGRGEQLDIAKAAFRDKLEREALRRAAEGVGRPVFQKGQRAMDIVTDAEGNVVYEDDGTTPKTKPAVVQEYSDRLMELVLKRHIPEYREKQQMDVNVSGGVLVLAAQAPASAEAWVKEHGDQTISADVKHPMIEGTATPTD